MSEPVLTVAEDTVRVLLVDDQRLVGESIRRMLADVPGLQFRFCADPAAALATAKEFGPTVILQDLVMPGVEGVEMVRAFHADAATRDVPLIVLSSKEEAAVKAEAFAAGANDYLVKLPDKVELIARIRYHSAAHMHRVQRDEAFRVLEEQQRVITQELADAAAYVRSLLPAPIVGSIPRAEWRFVTCSSLGGDSFGYHWLRPGVLAMYLLDVCGHGVGSALLSVSALNTLRNRTLPEVDFLQPGAVLAALNEAFPMGEENGKYFTLWYGVLDVASGHLEYAGGGHPPAVVVAPDGTVERLPSRGPLVGALPGAQFAQASATLAAGSKLFLYSDGCYEIEREGAGMVRLEEFVDALREAAPHANAPERMLQRAHGWAGGREFEDDFSLVAIEL